MLCYGWDLGLVSQGRSIENAPICSIKSLPLLGFLLQVLLKLTWCHGLGGQGLVKTIHYGHFCLFSCVLQSYQPPSVMKSFICQQHPGWTSLSTWLYGLLLWQYIRCWNSTFPGDIFVQKIQVQQIEVTEFCYKVELLEQEKKDWLETKNGQRLFFIFSIFFPLFALGPSDYHPDLHSGY